MANHGCMAGVPIYKVIPGTSFTVDGFRYPQTWVKGYFLSHAHSDHYTGLNENWSACVIYCSPITAALAEHLAGVPAQYLQPLQLDTPYNIEGVQVTLVDANHCPGAVMFLFELPDGSRYIHCGDMRYCRQMQDNPHLARFRGANAVFLDTTYCRPRHTFPFQEVAVEFVASRIQQLLQEDAQGEAADADSAEAIPLVTATAAADPAVATQPDVTDGGAAADECKAAADPQRNQQLQGSELGIDLEPSCEYQQQQQQQGCDHGGEDEPDSQVTAGEALGFKRLYLISTYVIGKERLLLAVAKRTGKRLFVTHRKLQVLRRIGLSDSDLRSCFTTDPHETPIHVLRWGVLGDTWPYFRPNYTSMEQVRTQTGAQEVVGFVPTGWLHEMSKAAKQGTFPQRVKGSCTVWLIPYSEHSSFLELKEFVAWLKPKQVIPTVNFGESGAAGDRHRSSMLQHFRGLLDETSNKAAFLARMASAATATNTTVLTAAVEDDKGTGTVPENGNEDLSGVSPLEHTNDAEGSWNCDNPQQPTAQALAAAAPAKGAPAADQSTAAISTEAGQGANNKADTAAAEVTAAKAPVDPAVQLLLAIAGPDSLLTAAEAQRLLTAARGDVNKAMNALLDSSGGTSGSQQNGAGPAVAAAVGGDGSGGKKRQQQHLKSVSSDSRKGSKKPGKQAAATAAGQAAITAFFGPRGTAGVQKQQLKQQHDLQPTQQPWHLSGDQPQQQQQQQGSVQQRRSISPDVQMTHQPMDAASLPSTRPKVLLPSLKRKSASPSPSPTPLAAAAARHGRQLLSVAADVHPVSDVPAVDMPQAAVQAGTTVPASSPAAEAGDASAHAADAHRLTSVAQDGEVPGSGLAVCRVDAGEADGVEARGKAAADAPAGPVPESLQQQQQQQTAVKQSWAALFSGALTSPAKRRKSSAAAPPQQLQAVGAITPASTAPSSELAVAAAAAPPAPAAGSNKFSTSTVPMLGASSSGSNSITKAMRDAPLLPITRYNPLTDACWSPGEAAPYLALGLTLAAVDGTSSRLRIADGLTNLFRSLMLLAPQDVTAAAYLICGKIAPEYSAGCELNVGGGVVSSALVDVCGVSRQQLRDMYAQHGDLGDVAQVCRCKQTSLLPPPPLIISGVFNTLHSLAAQSGQGAAGRRQSTVAKLLRCCRDVETKYLVRTLVQNLRVGAGWKSVLGPLAKAALLHRNMMKAAELLPTHHEEGQGLGGDPAASAEHAVNSQPPPVLDLASLTAAAQHAASSAAKVTKQQLAAAAAAASSAYHTCPNISIIVDVLMRYGPEGLASRVQLTCGVPVKPMLAKPCTSTDDALQQLAATAAAALTGGRRPGRAAGKKGVVKGLSATPAAAGDASAAAAGGGDSSDLEDVEVDDDVVLLDDDGAADEAVHFAEAAAPVEALAVDESAAGDFAAAAAGGVVSGVPVSGGLSILAEYKYDGQRAQIHVAQDGQVSIFSRNCEDRTHSFPDVAAAIVAAAAPEALPLVIDAELAAVDRTDSNRLRAFQELASRPRGSAAAAAAAAGARSPGKGAAAGDAGGDAAQKGSKPQQQRQHKQQKLELGQAQSAGNDASPLHQQLGQLHQQQQVQPHESGIDICIFAFDALCVGGQDLMGLSLRERRAALLAALPGAAPGVVQLAEGIEICVGDAAAGHAAATSTPLAVTASTSASGASAGAFDALGAEAVLSDAEQGVTDYFFKALAAGTEGLMIKLLDGPGSVYQPAYRGLSWIKLKRDYLEGLADSIDLVPIGAWQGQGRKVKWYSPFLLAVYDPSSETFQSLCRCISGFTDEFYAAATARLGATAIPGPKPYYETLERPDVWFEATEVWEIRGADISISPVHRAAAGRLHADRGLGLRFPRFLRIRDDKRPEEASGPDFIVDLYNKQTRRVINK